MNEIETQFNAAFSHWNIRLPPEDLAQRRRGKIVQAGWTIWYLFGADEHGDYLDYYATHHMTNDRHVRLYANGRSEGLPTMQEFRRGSEDPEEDARLEAEYHAENRRIGHLLAAKGFGPHGS